MSREASRERRFRMASAADNVKRYAPDPRPPWAAQGARTATASQKIRASNVRRAAIARLVMRRQAKQP